MKMWICRTKDNDLQLFSENIYEPPIYNEKDKLWMAWEVANPSAMYKVHGSWINPNRFPEATFENSPMEVELTLKQAGSSREEKQFDFKQCWTCESLIYDLDKGYICTKTNQQFVKREIVQPTDCEEWKRG